LRLTGIEERELGKFVETPAAAFLDLADPFDSALREPPPRHDQGLKW